MQESRCSSSGRTRPGAELVAPTLIAGVGEADRTDVIVPAIRRWAETFATSRTWVVHIREAPAVAAENEDERRADANVDRLVEALRAEGVDAPARPSPTATR